MICYGTRKTTASRTVTLVSIIYFHVPICLYSRLNSVNLTSARVHEYKIINRYLSGPCGVKSYTIFWYLINSQQLVFQFYRELSSNKKIFSCTVGSVIWGENILYDWTMIKVSWRGLHLEFKTHKLFNKERSIIDIV